MPNAVSASLGSTVDGAKVRGYREARKMERFDLALASGVGLGTIVQVEQGKATDLRTSTLTALARALRVPMEKLVRDL